MILEADQLEHVVAEGVICFGGSGCAGRLRQPAQGLCRSARLVQHVARQAEAGHVLLALGMRLQRAARRHHEGQLRMRAQRHHLSAQQCVVLQTGLLSAYHPAPGCHGPSMHTGAGLGKVSSMHVQTGLCMH